MELEVVGAPRSEVPESPGEWVLFLAIGALALADWGDPGWLGGSVRSDLVPVLAMPVGPELVAALAALPQGGACPAIHEQEPVDRGLPPHGTAGNPCLCMLAVAAAWAACRRWMQERERQALLDAVGREPVELDTGHGTPLVDPAREELAGALRQSPGAAAGRIARARRLSEFPRIAGLVAQGLLDQEPADRAASGLQRLDPAEAAQAEAELEARVRARAAAGRRPWNGAQVCAALRRIAARMPSYAAARGKAREQRRVERWSNGDGTATLEAVLPEIAAERIHRRLTAMATGLGPEDPRTMDQRRADLLTQILLGEQRSAATGVEVLVVLDEACSVPGVGEVPACEAAELLAAAPWRPALRGPDGTISAVAVRAYAPSPALARLVRARHRHCAAPGCQVPAERCDLDHIVPWPSGPTTADNLQPLCRRHHRLKTHTPWRPTSQGWVTPAGVAVRE